MKYNFITLIILLLLIFSGCSVTQFNYSSKADFPHYSSSTETKMNVVLNDTRNNRAYGIITAVDNEETEYILIAPKDGTIASDDNDVSDFNITEATYIDLNAVQNFSESLQKISSEWDNLNDDDGYFYEFSSVPEIEFQQIDEKAVTYAPSVRFFFNVTDEGSTGELIIEYHNYRTAEATIRRIDFDEKEKIDDLQSLLDKALEHYGV